MELMTVNKTYGVKVLDSVVSEIKKTAAGIANSEFIIAMQFSRALNNVTDDEYADIDFKNFQAWAANAFGVKKSTAYNYAKIGEHVRGIEISTGRGKTTKKIYRFDLWYEYCKKSGEVYSESCDFTIGQIISMTMKNVNYDDLMSMCLDGAVNPNMSCRELKQAVKDWYAEPAEETAADEEQAEEQAADEEPAEAEPLNVIDTNGRLYSVKPENMQETTLQELHFVRVWDDAGVMYEIPFEFINAFRK